MRVVLLINNTAGFGGHGVFDLVRRVGDAASEVVIRYVSGDVTIDEVLSDADSFDRVVVAGGDGTVSSTCYALRDRDVPILAYPAGTANLLAANLGLPHEAAALAELLVAGPSARFDLGELEATLPSGEIYRSGFILMAGAGYDAQIMRAAAPHKSTFGAAAYLAAAVTNPTPTVADLTIDVDGEHVSARGFAVLVSNFGRIQFDVPLVPGANPTDGRLEVAVATGKTAAGLIPVVATAFLDRGGALPDRGPDVQVYSGAEIRVAADPALHVQWDGEVDEALTPFTIRVLPRATRLIVPNGSPFANRGD